MPKTTEKGRLVSFDESGFTGPELLNEDQPYFVYASHDLSEAEAASLLDDLRTSFRIQGPEFKANKLRKRKYWEDITQKLCEATNERSKVVTYNKKAALAGKFFEYFFEPVLAENSMAFYSIDFQKYIMNTMVIFMRHDVTDFTVLWRQIQAFMRTFVPEEAPDIFAGRERSSIELERILKFCRGYADTIARETSHLRLEEYDFAKWTLDLTSTSLFSLLFRWWGHRHPRITVLCDDSKPLTDVADFFDRFVGKDQTFRVTDGNSLVNLRGNLVEPLQFGSSEAHPTLQVADLLAGMTADVCTRTTGAPGCSREWVRRHRMTSNSIDFDADFVSKGNPIVRIGREVLKELSRRADARADPLEGMDEFIRKIHNRFLS